MNKKKLGLFKAWLHLLATRYQQQNKHGKYTRAPVTETRLPPDTATSGLSSFSNLSRRANLLESQKHRNRVKQEDQKQAAHRKKEPREEPTAANLQRVSWC